MRKSLRENIVAVSIGTAIALITMLAFGFTIEMPLLFVLNGIWLGIIFMVVDELEFKFEYYRNMLNWQEWVGCGAVLFADTCFFGFIWSGSMLSFWLWLCGAVLVGVGAFLWFMFAYTPSVMRLEDKDKYDRKRFEKRLHAALEKNDVSRIKKYFSIFLRYRCVNGSFEAGSDYASPFDSDKYRSLRELSLSETETDKLTTSEVTDYENALAEKYLADYNAKKGVKGKN